jgi:hypothetical protein
MLAGHVALLIRDVAPWVRAGGSPGPWEGADMSRVVLLDADVIGHLNRGSKKAAAALKKLLDSGAKVYVSHQAYAELTSQPGKKVAGVGPDSPQTAAANKKLIEDLGIRVAPATKLADRVDVYDRNANGKALSATDQMVAAEARALNAEVWSFDKAYRNNGEGVTRSFGVKIAKETEDAYEKPVGREDYRKARRLMGLTKVEITKGGTVLPRTKPKPPSGSGGAGGGLSKGVAKMPDKASLKVDPEGTRGGRMANGVELGLKGINAIIQGINDHIQAKRIKESWDRIMPNVEKQLAKDPENGALVLVRVGRRKDGNPETPLEHTNLFLSIDVEYGKNESEAWDAYVRRSRLSTDAGMDVSVQRTFIPPRNTVDVKSLRTPFTAYGVATFAPGKARFMTVSWNGHLGFDEEGDVKVSIPDGVTPQFLLLLAPNELEWLNGPSWQTTDVAVDWRNAASSEPHVTRSVSVVDMDAGVFDWGNDSAAMVFPADAATARIFAGAAKTKDNHGQLNRLVNFDQLRWVRPKHIHVLRKFMED